jgi:uncharacterized membrane protein HdeD (DUF308 family)
MGERQESFPWWQLVALGLATIAFGVAVLVWPHVSLRILAVFIGLWLVFVGGTRIAGAFASGPGLGRRLLWAVAGLIALIAGLMCLTDEVIGRAAVVLLVATTWLLSGLVEVAMGVRGEPGTRGWLLALGIFSTVTGLAFLVWPALSLASLVILTGVSGVVVGAAELVFAFRLRRALDGPDTVIVAN